MIDEKKLIEDIKEKLYPEKFGERCNALDVINAFMQVIDEQPKIGEWIPCSERMPEPKIEIMVTLRDCSKYVFSGYRTEPTEETESCFYVDGHGFKTIDNVLAWQTLPEPEPYREDK